MIKPEDVTIIIPHLGATEKQTFSLGQCLKSLRTVSSEIIVSINGRLEQDRDVFIESDRLILLEEQGQCKAVNAAASTVNTEWLFITNDDMIYAPGWFERMCEAINGSRSFEGTALTFSCISPVLVEPQDGAPPFIKYFAGGAGGDFNKKLWEGFVEDYYEGHTYGVEEGFNLPFLIRKDLWDMVGGYDVAYDPWGSNGDSDLQAKIHLAGAKTWRNRNCAVYHFSTTSGTFHPDNHEYWKRNWNYFIEKWGFERQGDKNKVWYSKELIDYDKLIYRPWWEGKWKT
jgi:GT2 family glycosyltransferase